MGIALGFRMRQKILTTNLDKEALKDFNSDYDIYCITRLQLSYSLEAIYNQSVCAIFRMSHLPRNFHGKEGLDRRKDLRYDLVRQYEDDR